VALRSRLLLAARDDARLSGGAITGSAATGREDAWSDIDLAFGVAGEGPVDPVVADWTQRMYADCGAVHHLDALSGPWHYRVFLLADTLQVDLAFVPAAHYRARAPSFQLVFGAALEPAHVPPPEFEALVGTAWLYALHVRAALARGRPWQGEYMVSAMRDQVLALACLRHGLPAR